MLVAGSVIIGRREEGKDDGGPEVAGAVPAVSARDGSTDGAFAPRIRPDHAASSDSQVGRGDNIELRRKPRAI